MRRLLTLLVLLMSFAACDTAAVTGPSLDECEEHNVNCEDPPLPDKEEHNKIQERY